MKKNHLHVPLLCLLCIVMQNAGAQTPNSANGITKVFDYKPAPGQFLNTMPEYEDGDTDETMRQKAEQLLCEGGTISLGAFGGYVVVGFDHMVENKAGLYDLQVFGNSYLAGTGDARQGGSSEPAVVYVSYDANANGLPDDEWYELAGSEYGKVNTLEEYTVTYHRTPSNHIPTPMPNSPVTDTTYIRWTDSQGAEGFLHMNAYHRQSYWPQWLAHNDSLTFCGVRLAPNTVDKNGDGSYFVQSSYAWGYADNQPNDSTCCMLDIDWAVDKEGSPVRLKGIHFVKVQTAVLQSNGWIGESSTEVAGVMDLHISGETVPTFDENLMVLTFEDEDSRNGATYWTDLIDSPQYGGPLLYGASGTGAYSEAEAYRWCDDGRTRLSSVLNLNWGAWAYWNGGIAVSDYVDSNIKDVPYTEQLTVFSQTVSEAVRTGGGHTGSDHFAVINGVDNTPWDGADTRAVLHFADGVARVIDHMWVAPTTYLLSNMVHGSSFCTAAKEGTWVDLVCEGLDAEGRQTGVVSLRLVEDMRMLRGWVWTDLSALGKVHAVRFNFHVSDDQIGAYGVNTPTYVAIDDVAVRMEDGDESGIDDVLSPHRSSTSSAKTYDLNGRELRHIVKGQIVIVAGKKRLVTDTLR